MTDIIDRARLAVVEVIQSSDLPTGTYIDSEKIVRAVIEAIRSPTREMLERGHAVNFGYYPTQAWQAMIDEALGDAQSP